MNPFESVTALEDTTTLDRFIWVVRFYAANGAHAARLPLRCLPSPWADPGGRVLPERR